ncbi:MAG: DNA integrity scanning protein DisA nucleotide-binding domain protein [Bacillota bacterium]|nr:DNA integrity scanning protein DisA nucleotide-binding domain protein [Bacillota bacterium]
MNFDFSRLDNFNNLVSFIATAAVLFLVDVLLIFKLTKKSPLLFLFLSEAVALAAYPLSLDLLCYVAIGFSSALFFLALYVNSHELHFLYSNPRLMKSVGMKSGKKVPEALFDREEMYAKIDKAVQYFSKNKIGALMTFERKDSLQSFINTGVKVNAPVSSELLQTIFYEGTYLHDGAVIIRNDQIVSAACLFQPSTKPVSGKMGLRHRAAMGISEITDSVTVVVSEETGRISIAYGGELETVQIDDFLETFTDFMSLGMEHSEKKEEGK